MGVHYTPTGESFTFGIRQGVTREDVERVTSELQDIAEVELSPAGVLTVRLANTPRAARRSSRTQQLLAQRLRPYIRTAPTRDRRNGDSYVNRRRDRRPIFVV